jgi:hypothetical protein
MFKMSQDISKNKMLTRNTHKNEEQEWRTRMKNKNFIFQNTRVNVWFSKCLVCVCVCLFPIFSLYPMGIMWVFDTYHEEKKWMKICWFICHANTVGLRHYPTHNTPGQHFSKMWDQMKTLHQLFWYSLPKEYPSTLANSTLIILFSKMLNLKKNDFFQIKKYCEG